MANGNPPQSEANHQISSNLSKSMTSWITTGMVVIASIIGLVMWSANVQNTAALAVRDVAGLQQTTAEHEARIRLMENNLMAVKSTQEVLAKLLSEVVRNGPLK